MEIKPMSDKVKNTDYVLDLNNIDGSIKAIVGMDPNEIELSDWFGSCQYRRSELYHRLLDKVGHEALGISFTKAHKKPTTALLDEIYSMIVGRYESHAKEYQRDIELLEAGDEAWKEYFSKSTYINTKQERYDAIVGNLRYDERRFRYNLELVDNGIADWTLEQCMEWTRDNSWDLWSAAPFIMGYQFDNLEFKPIENPAAGKGWPLLNAMIQGSESYDTGMATHLLHKFCKVPLSAMDGFDT
tara:strand:- start:66 stop:794 length:729 start_codon:yes stop_codon:yes gene_type:complete